MNVRKSYLNNYNFQKKNGIYQVKIIGTKNWIPVSEDVYKELTHSTWNHEQKMTREEKKWHSMPFSGFCIQQWLLLTRLFIPGYWLLSRIPLRTRRLFAWHLGKAAFFSVKR